MHVKKCPRTRETNVPLEQRRPPSPAKTAVKQQDVYAINVIPPAGNLAATQHSESHGRALSLLLVCVGVYVPATIRR